MCLFHFYIFPLLIAGFLQRNPKDWPFTRLYWVTWGLSLLASGILGVCCIALVFEGHVILWEKVALATSPFLAILGLIWSAGWGFGKAEDFLRAPADPARQARIAHHAKLMWVILAALTIYPFFFPILLEAIRSKVN